MHFVDPSCEPKVDIHLDHIEAGMFGLTNKPGIDEKLPAAARVRAQAMGSAEVKLALRLDPLAKEPTFYLDGELSGLPVTELNDYLRAYAKVDAEAGTLSLYTELAAAQGLFKGYVKPLLQDVKFSAPKDGKGKILKTARRVVFAGVEAMLENQEKRIGGEIPLSGSFVNPHVGVFSSVISLLRNAFAHAIEPGLSHSIDFSSVESGETAESEEAAPRLTPKKKRAPRSRKT